MFIDLDHTLLDAERFKGALQKRLRSLGVGKNDFVSTYARLRRRRSFAILPFVKLFSFPKNMQGNAVGVLEQETKNVGRFLYSDARPFLRLMKRKKVRVIIFTYGDPGFQRMKLQGLASLRPYISRVLITSREKKNSALPQYKGDAIMIDNRPEVVEFYAKRYGMMPIVLDRKGRKGAHHYRSLMEVAKMLKRKGIV